MSDIEVGTKRSVAYEENGDNDAYKRPKSDGNVRVRLLLVGRNCGALIGKGGANIQRLREENQVKINGLNTRTHDRVLSIDGNKDNVIAVIKEIVVVCSEVPYPAYTQGKCSLELNLLVNSDAVGLVIGKGGTKIKEIADQSGGKLKVYPDCLPNSNERVIAVGGDDEGKLVVAVELILNILMAASRQYHTTPYDPSNMNSILGSAGNMHNKMGGGGNTTNRMGGGPGILGQSAVPPANVNHLDVASVLMSNRNNTPMNTDDPLRPDFTQVKTETKLLVPHDMCGAIIGKAGQNIRTIRQSSGAKIDFSESNKESKEDRIITITGTQGQVQIAEQLMTQCVRNR